MAASAVDPAMIRFTGPYRRSCGFAPYASKLSEEERDAMAAEAAAGRGGGGGGGGGGAHALGSTGGGSPSSPARSPPRQNSLALPPPMAATTTSFAEIKAYRQRNVVPKYGPTERFAAPMTEAMEAGWRAAESRPSEAARNFSRALSGKA